MKNRFTKNWVQLFCFVLLCFGQLTANAQGNGSCIGEAGTIEWLVFPQIYDNNHDDVFARPDFPQAPKRVFSMPTLATDDRYDDDFAGLVRGYILAPETGQYVFNICTDDDSYFKLSTDTFPENMVQIASIPGWAGTTEHYKYPEQTSDTISLVAGNYYYFEGFYQEGGGGDHFIAYWKTPSTINDDDWAVIGTDYIARQNCIVNCKTKGTPCDDGDPNTINDQEDGNCHCAGTPTTLPFACIGERGSIKALYYDGVGGNDVDDLTADPSYPLMPTRAEILPSIKGPLVGTNDHDDFGTRITGYLRAPESGYYVFNITGNNNASLFFSANENIDQTTDQIAYTSGSTSDLEHLDDPSQTSDSIYLNEGQFYSIEVLHKEGLYGEHFGVFWRTPFKRDTFFKYLDASFLYHTSCELACIPEGTPCNDGDAMTFDDMYDDSCYCVGTPCVDEDCTNALPYDPIDHCGTDGEHSNSAQDSWLSCEPAPSPNPLRGDGYWIQYDFGYVFSLENAQIWNYNVAGATDYGFQNVVIDYSLDGVNWYELGEFNWAQANGTNSYSGFLFDALDGVTAQYLLITGIDNFGTGDCFGLSEININASQCLQAGNACDDGNPDTTNDTYDYACNCIGTSIVADNNCEQDTLVFAHVITSSGAFDAAQLIVSEAVVELGSNVTYIAGESIKLMPGFKAVKNSHFKAIIDPCSAEFSEGGSAYEIEEEEETAHEAEERTSDDNENAVATFLKVAPNPARNWTRIEYAISQEGPLNLSVFNASGNLVQQLYSGNHPAQTSYKEFPAHQLMGGIYYVVLQTPNQTITEKMVVIK